MDRLEERLRQGLAGDVDESVSISLGSVRAGARRRRIRRTGLLAAACVAVVGVAAVVTAQPFDDDGDAGPATPELPENAVVGVADVSVSYDAAEDRISVLKLTTNVGCAGCSTVWRQDPEAEGGWEPLHDFEASRAELRFGPVQEFEFADNGLDGYAWNNFILRNIGDLHVTHDGGRTWSTVDSGPGLSRDVFSIGLTATDLWSRHRSGEGRGSRTELWRSPLGSDEWYRVDLRDGLWTDLLFATDHGIVLEEIERGIAQLHSSADGVTWNRLRRPCGPDNRIVDSPVGLFVSCPAASGEVVYRSTDLESWHEFGVSELDDVATLMPIAGDRVLLVALGPESDGTEEGLLLTPGASRPVDLGLAPGEYLPPWTWSAAGDTVYAATSQRRIVASTDGGQTWSEVE